MTDLYDQRIDAMKARERADDFASDFFNDTLFWRYMAEGESNAQRRADYKRKRAIQLCHERHRDPFRDMTGPNGPLKAWELYT